MDNSRGAIRTPQSVVGPGLPSYHAGGAVPFPHPNTIYWGGYGGSIAIIDMDARTTFSYVMNKMQGTTTGDMRGFSLLGAAWSGLATG